MTEQELKDKIKGTKRKVQILSQGTEGQALCFKVRYKHPNRVLDSLGGEFVVCNCHYLSDENHIDKNSLCGLTTLKLPDGSTCDFRAMLIICSQNNSIGYLTLYC